MISHRSETLTASQSLTASNTERLQWLEVYGNKMNVWEWLIYSIPELKEARNSFFDLGVYLVKSKFRIEDKRRFPWYYTTFSKYDQSLFSHWFPSNSYHHTNGNGQPLILNNVEDLEN